MKPLINQGISFATGAAGVPMLGNAINSAIDAGSNWLDENFGTKSNKQIEDFSKFSADFALDTQRPQQDKKY